jgi:hypothetical protein
MCNDAYHRESTGELQRKGVLQLTYVQLWNISSGEYWGRTLALWTLSWRVSRDEPCVPICSSGRSTATTRSRPVLTQLTCGCPLSSPAGPPRAEGVTDAPQRSYMLTRKIRDVRECGTDPMLKIGR